MAQKQPNIVFFFWDNLAWGEVGCYGGGILRGAPTPRIDALARGTRSRTAPSGAGRQLTPEEPTEE